MRWCGVVGLQCCGVAVVAVVGAGMVYLIN